MMPVPSHLVNCVVPASNVINESPLIAVVHCPCGSERFELAYPGRTHEWQGQPIPCTAEIDGNFFFLVAARCARCKREHLLLDKDFHGWDGFVCHDPTQASLPRPQLVTWKCLKCGGTEHEAVIHIHTEGKADFIEQTDGEYDEDRWPDGFGWFDMDIKCPGCGLTTPTWISYETM